MLLQCPETISDAAKLLDKEIPGWYKRIDITKLSMSSGQYCILGQLYTGNQGCGTAKYERVCIELFGKCVSANEHNNPFGTYADKEGWIYEIAIRAAMDYKAPTEQPKPKRLTFNMKCLRMAIEDGETEIALEYFTKIFG